MSWIPERFLYLRLIVKALDNCAKDKEDLQWLLDDSYVPGAISFRECCDVCKISPDLIRSKLSVTIKIEGVRALEKRFDEGRIGYGGITEDTGGSYDLAKRELVAVLGAGKLGKTDDYYSATNPSRFISA